MKCSNDGLELASKLSINKEGVYKIDEKREDMYLIVNEKYEDECISLRE